MFANEQAMKSALPPNVVQQMDAQGIDWSKLFAFAQTIMPLLLALFAKTPSTTPGSLHPNAPVGAAPPQPITTKP